MPIPLDQLPPPAAVAVEEVAAVRERAIARLVELAPGYEPRPTDPAVRLLEVAAYLRVLLGARVNDAVRATYLATAAGSDLDHVAANVNVARLAGEADAALRRRAQLAWEALSVAGPREAYRFHALAVRVTVGAGGEQVVVGVRHAGVSSPTPGAVVVTILADTADAATPAELVAAVDEALSAETVRPVTDQVTVRAAARETYRVAAELRVEPGPDAEVVRAAAEAAVRAHVGRLEVGRTVYRSALTAALHVPGAARVDLTEPAADVAADNSKVAVCTRVTLTTTQGS